MRRTYCQILVTMQPAPRIDQCLLHQLNPEEEDKSADNHDRDVTNNDRTDEKNTASSSSEHNPCQTGITSTANEK